MEWKRFSHSKAKWIFKKKEENMKEYLWSIRLRCRDENALQILEVCLTELKSKMFFLPCFDSVKLLFRFNHSQINYQSSMWCLKKIYIFPP